MKNSTTNTKRHTLRCAVYLFMFKDNKILLLRRKNTGWKDGEYAVPAGHLEKGETISQAAVREAKEETSVDINEKDLKFAHLMHRIGGKGEYIDIYFTLDKWTGEPSIGEEDLADDMSWYPISSLPENTVDYIQEAFNHLNKGISFSEF